MSAFVGNIKSPNPQVLHQGHKHPASKSVTSLKVYPWHSDPSHLSKASAASAILSPQFSELRTDRLLSGWPVSEWTYVVLFGWSFLNLIMWQSGVVMENKENGIIFFLLETGREKSVYFHLGNVIYLVMLRKKYLSWFCIIIPIHNAKMYWDIHARGSLLSVSCKKHAWCLQIAILNLKWTVIQLLFHAYMLLSLQTYLPVNGMINMSCIFASHS